MEENKEEVKRLDRFSEKGRKPQEVLRKEKKTTVINTYDRIDRRGFILTIISLCILGCMPIVFGILLGVVKGSEWTFITYALASFLVVLVLLVVARVYGVCDTIVEEILFKVAVVVWLVLFLIFIILALYSSGIL